MGPGEPERQPRVPAHVRAAWHTLSPPPYSRRRRAQKSKELARNKKERSLQRDAQSKTADPATLRQELQEVLAAEQTSSNPALRLKKKTLQHAYEQALKKQMVRWRPTHANAAMQRVLIDPGLPTLPFPPALLPTGGHGRGQGGRVGAGARARGFGVLPPDPEPPRPAAARQDAAVRSAV